MKMEKNEIIKLGMPVLLNTLNELYGKLQAKTILTELRQSGVKGKALKVVLADYITGKRYENQKNNAKQEPVVEGEIEYVKDTFEEYLGKKTHISASDIKNFLHSPRYYYYKAFEEVKQPPKENERHFPIGSAVHELTLEPELFWTNYIVAPKFDMRTKVGKDGYAEFVEKSKGKTILYQEELEMAVRMADVGTQNATFMELIKESYRELSCYTKDEKTGLLIRMRPDSFAKKKSTIVDIKTCQDSSPKGFKRDVYKFGYNISASFYTDFLKRENYVFCAMEKTQPHQTALYVLDDEMMEKGRAQYRMALDLLKWSIDNNYWCDYNEFEILKECYELGNLDEFFEIRDKSEKITILR